MNKRKGMDICTPLILDIFLKYILIFIKQVTIDTLSKQIYELKTYYFAQIYESPVYNRLK